IRPPRTLSPNLPLPPAEPGRWFFFIAAIFHLPLQTATIASRSEKEMATINREASESAANFPVYRLPCLWGHFATGSGTPEKSCRGNPSFPFGEDTVRS